MKHSNNSVCAIILAAGKGTRMKSSTPKVLHKVAGTPMIHRIMEQLHQIGVNSFCLILGEHTSSLVSSIDTDVPFTAVQQMNLLGTGDAVAAAAAAFEGCKLPPYTSSRLLDGGGINSDYVLIAAGDTPAIDKAILTDFMDKTIACNADISLIGMKHPHPSGYGRLVMKDNQLDAIVEEKDANTEQKQINLCNTGVIMARTSTLFSLLHQLDNNNAQSEYYLTDCFEIAKARGSNVYVHQTDQYECFNGVNNRSQLETVESYVMKQIRQRWMLQGVTFHLADTTYIEDSVTIGQDTEIGSNCTLIGSTSIGAGCTIGHKCIIQNKVIEDGQVIPSGTQLIG